MPCDIKRHIVEEKWARRRKRQEGEEAERVRREEGERIPLPDNWPVRVPLALPAGAPREAGLD